MNNTNQDVVSSNVQTTLAFIPCDEHDENCTGSYTSNDGRSLCHVREIKVAYSDQYPLRASSLPTPTESEAIKEELERRLIEANQRIAEMDNMLRKWQQLDARICTSFDIARLHLETRKLISPDK